MNIAYIRLFAFYVVAVILTVSCAGTPSTAGDYPPLLPPINSMEMQVPHLHFDSSATDTSSNNDHFTRASDLVMSIDEDIHYLKLPATILAAAHENHPEVNEKNQWEWRYKQDLDGHIYPIRLVASRKTENKVRWEFYLVNAQLGMEDQLFLSGESNTEGTSGTWTLYKQNGEPSKERAQLKWAVHNEIKVNKKLDIKDSSAGMEGNSIEYTFDGKRKTVILYDADAGESIEIQQNIGSNIGYIFSPSYNEGEQACWDKAFSDISCSEV